jgi:hypothetical protein
MAGRIHAATGQAVLFASYFRLYRKMYSVKTSTERYLPGKMTQGKVPWFAAQPDKYFNTVEFSHDL